VDDLTQADLAFIQSSGRDPQAVATQLHMLRGGWRSLHLARPTTIGDGITQLDSTSVGRLDDLHRRAAAAGRISSFVPASGSGTRLFQSLLAFHRERVTTLEEIQSRAMRGEAAAKDALVVLDNIRDFAIWPELERQGCAPEALGTIFETLFAEGGRRYHDLPKGLIPFHRYDDGIRTAFAEHLREAAALGTDAQRRCRVHFTVSATHLESFEETWRRERVLLERELQTTFEVQFSVQAPDTDAIGVDSSGAILRDASGRVAFRPGGHGALLANLGAGNGDIVLIKNIDNIARAEFLDAIVQVRRSICGLLLAIEADVHAALRGLRNGDDEASALELLATRFGIQAPAGLQPEDARRRDAIAQLDRPIRVCAVVATDEHAGGRPFWIDTPGRGVTPQLVEGAEVALDNPQERDLFHQSRHFNPVDIACAIRDADGRPFDLQKFAVPDRPLIARKVVDGKTSLVYEHPGLWNGGMGLWNTVFVEVPASTFNPVKSLADLWAPGHRGGPVT
jgi:hypothetical protein